MRAARLAFLAAMVITVAYGKASAAEFLTADSKGWHTWQVDEPSAITQMCCFSWKNGSTPRAGCNLDGHNIGFSDSGDCAVKPGTMQVYVYLLDGAPKDIRVLSSNCPVSTQSGLVDHGKMSAGDNLNWFRSVIEDKTLSGDAREEALFGLVQSGSDAAYDYLDKLLSHR